MEQLPTATKAIIEIILALTIFGGLIGLIISRHIHDKSIGARFIQMVGVIFMIPAILILGL